MAVKVSVVVATYCSPADGFARLVRSLDEQTLPQSEFEVIFVDDGSPGDETWRMLEEARAGRPNVTIEQIEHSGWPSRPRNVGMDLATGEYVFFADHDDEMFPDGLRVAWQFATEHDLDIVSAKEIETHLPGHAFDSFARDTWGTRSELGVLDLVPMVPHKLYRRELLAERGVRFIEGSRVIWEDIYFNIDAYAVARRLGTLGSSSVYLHVIGAANASHSYRPDNEEYWQTVTRVLEHIDRVLAGEEFAEERRVLFPTHYRDRVLRRAAMLADDGNADALQMAVPYIREIARRWLDPAAVSGFPLRDRYIHELAQAEDFDALGTFAKRAARVIATSTTTRVGWRDHELIIEAAASWTAQPSEVEPGYLAPRDQDEVEMIAGEIAGASSNLILRARADKDTTTLQTTQSVEASDVSDPLGALRLTACAALRADRPAGAYDVHARDSAFGFTNTRAVRTSTPVRLALIDGIALIAYRNNSGMLTIDVGQTVRSIVNSARRRYDRVSVSRSLSGLNRISLPLDGVHIFGITRIEGSVLLDGSAQRYPAALVGDTSGARVEFAVKSRPGRYPLAFDFGDRLVPSHVVLTVSSRLGRPSLSDH